MLKYPVIFLYFWVHFDCNEIKPLFLTSLIEKGEIETAQKTAEVKPFLPNVKSYSGYLTVDSAYNSNLFFWFFPKTSDWTKAPLVLWLQGGPGSSSLFGLFVENGPYDLRRSKLKNRRHSWTNYFNVLYIDNPVGTGFSFTDSPEGYATNQTTIGENLYEALRQFFLLFPQMQNNKLILSGESYAGKYLPTLAYTILKKKVTKKPKINVYGLFMGNPFISLGDMLLHYNNYFASHGLLDKNGQEILREREELILAHIYAKRWVHATELFAQTFFSGLYGNKTLFRQLTGIPNLYNMLRDELSFGKYYSEYLNKNETKSALHVRENKFGENQQTVYGKLKADISMSMAPHFEIVLENFRTFIFSGQLDIICPYYLQLQLSKNLDWSGNWDYNQALRQPLKWKKHLCGYFKTAKQFTEAMIRNSGHFTPTDRPQWTLGLLQKFVKGEFDSSKRFVDISY